jgi:hypothetical protein
MEPEDIKNIFSKPGVVNIYTGKLLCVGTRHIEYDINSFTGCSGAVVFLLDEKINTIRFRCAITARQSQSTVELTQL